MATRCPICQYVRDERIFVMCKQCGHAYDRFQRTSDDGTPDAGMLWVARRAIRYERRRVAEQKKLFGLVYVARTHR